MMEICVLGSGSKGNCTYVREGDTRIIVDAGLSCLQIKKRLHSIGRDIDDIDAVLVTHEHTDHVKGLTTFSKKHDVPVYINRACLDNSDIRLNHIMPFDETSRLRIGCFDIEPVRTSHDSAFSCGFVITNGLNLGIFTDLGEIPQDLKRWLPDLDCAVMEANHDVDMLINGPYPYPLKQRIMGREGHLSNIDSALAVAEYASDRLKKVFLAHLSENNNRPELAEKAYRSIFAKENQKARHILTWQDRPTRLVCI